MENILTWIYFLSRLCIFFVTVSMATKQLQINSILFTNVVSW